MMLLPFRILFWEHWCRAGSNVVFLSPPIGIKSGCWHPDSEVAVPRKASQADIYNASLLIFSVIHKVTSSYYDILLQNEPQFHPSLMWADHICKLGSAKQTWRQCWPRAASHHYSSSAPVTTQMAILVILEKDCSLVAGISFVPLCTGKKKQVPAKQPANLFL